MTALTHRSHLGAGTPIERRVFLGFAQVFQKELLEWIRSRRMLVVATVATAFGTLGALSAWLEQTVGDLRISIGDPGAASAAAKISSVDPTVTTLAIFQVPIVPVLAILATTSLIVGERASGTLSWSLSMPMSRTAVLVAKWTAAMIAFGIAAIAIPTIVSGIASTIAYGGVPDVSIDGSAAALYLAVPAFYVAFTLMLGVLTTSPAAIAGLGLLVLLSPAFLGSLVPHVVLEALPVGIGGWAVGVAAGSPVSVATPLGWLISMVVLAILAPLAFRRVEL